MRKWLVLASYDGTGSKQDRLDSDPDTLDRVATIVSGDGDRPLDGDISEALAGHGSGEYLFVPLDGDTFAGRLEVTQRVETVWSGNYAY